MKDVVKNVLAPYAITGYSLKITGIAVDADGKATVAWSRDQKAGKPLEFGHLAGDPPAKARRIIADEVMRAIADLSGQEYVHEYASDVKAKMGL